MARRSSFHDNLRVAPASLAHGSKLGLASLTATLIACASAGEPVSNAPTEVVPVASAAPSARSTPRRAPDLDAVSELDDRTDSLAEGGVARVAGAKAEVRAPGKWTLDTDPSGDGARAWVLARGADARAALHVGLDDGTDAALTSATSRIGLSACSWAPSSDVNVGVEKRPCVALDGTCSLDGVPVRAAVLRDAPDRLLVLGVWAERADGAAIFGAMRSLGPVTLEGTALCCEALRATAKSATPALAPVYAGAAAICDASAKDPSGIAALRSLLARTGASLPGACR